MKVHLHYFSKIKSQKESQNSRIQGFSYYFCMMIEGSGSRAGSGPGRPKTRGSGTLLKTRVVDLDPDPYSALIWLSWIRIRIGNADTDPDSGALEFIKIYQ